MSKKAEQETPRLILRTYKASDHDQVDHLFYSTYFALVPEGVKCKLKSPLFWTLWAAFYAYLLSIVPVILAGMSVPSWASTALKIFLTASWILVSFAGVFVVTDRFEVVDRVEQVRQNDLSDPEIYYLNWTKEEVEIPDEDIHRGSERKIGKKRVTFDKDAKPATEIIRKQKPVDQQSPSHFWVLTLENRPCGMVGLAHYNEQLLSNRPTQPPAWKLLLAAMFRRYHIPLPEFLNDLYSKMPTPVFANPHESNVAELQRLAVKIEYQSCSLSTLLIDRAMSWANDQGIERVIAKTNELQSVAADILRSHHGFELIKKERKGWFGQYEKTWSCNVKKWMESHEKGANTYKKQQQ